MLYCCVFNLTDTLTPGLKVPISSVNSISPSHICKFVLDLKSEFQSNVTYKHFLKVLENFKQTTIAHRFFIKFQMNRLLSAEFHKDIYFALIENH